MLYLMRARSLKIMLQILRTIRLEVRIEKNQRKILSAEK